MSEKNCSYCGLTKSINEFGFKLKSKNKYQSYCKECNKSYHRQHYLDNKQDYLKKAKKYDQKFKRKVEDFLLNYLLSHPCVDCGEVDPVVLEFDHVRGIKQFNISFMLQRGFSIDNLKLEINKCDVRCCNCHRRKTTKERNWWLHKRLSSSGQEPPLSTGEQEFDSP